MPVLCACGCGQPVRLATATNRKYGWVKGQPMRYVSGHNNRDRTPGKYPGRKVGAKVYMLHRLRAEHALGRALPRSVIVHHADGTTDPNAPLVICQDQRYHMLLHVRMRVVRAGGNPDTQRVCGRCDTLHDKNETSASGWCRGCHNAYYRALRASRRVANG
jgi:hypothetical protein